jgi:GTP-binding protein
MPIKAVFIGSYSNVNQLPADNIPQFAFAGRSNVGKSTLLNRLVGHHKLARTSKTPGRTQTINFFLIDDRYYFVDLPGYGFAKAPEKARLNWGKLVDNYVNSVNNLCGFIFLLDSRREPNEMDMMMLNWLEEKGKKYVFVLTKADKISKSELLQKMRQIEKIFKVKPIPFSDIAGIGKAELLGWIESLVKSC